jgi:hypothetical protein
MAMIEGDEQPVLRRLLWMAAIWAASVVTVFAGAEVIRLCLRS